MTNIPTIYEGKRGWSDKQHMKDNKIKIVCCDCGLTHEFHFGIENKKVVFKIRMDKQTTNKVRKYDTLNFIEKSNV